MKQLLAIILALVLFFVFSIPNEVMAEKGSDALGFNETLLPYVEDEIYEELINALDGTDYVVENVEAIYISQEYIEEVAYNTKANIFFGYTLAELDAQFEGTRYVFTLGDDNQTTVIPFQEYIDKDAIYTRILKNVAIGAGVILVCVTIAAVTYTAAPAISIVFAFGAKTGLKYAAYGAGFGFVAGGTLKYIQTGDLEKSFEAGLIEASEGFKWGAIAGSISGTVKETTFLCKWHNSTHIGWNEAAQIQRDSSYSLDFIRTVHSMEEYEVYKSAGLVEYRIGNQRVLLPKDVNLNQVYDGLTNRQRLLAGYNPVDSSGKLYEWHHVGQQNSSPLALLTYDQHRKNYAVLTWREEPEIDRVAFAKLKKEMNMALGNNLELFQ
ncbi:MAG: hypothetical protein IKI24_07650 [Clostridia bacterium]|nr:hypothetical protein [Clostridia bacterium]